LKRVGVLTSGGDSPGMNAAIRAITRTAIYGGLSVVGFFNGFEGLIKNKFEELDLTSVGGQMDKGGTFLGTARVPEFETSEGQKKATANLKKLGVDAVIVVGGDGSLRGAHVLYSYGILTMGVPASIDNDLWGTDYCIGFDTAVNTAIDAISKIRDTASAFERTFLVEVMGRNSGMIALYSAIAGGADCVVIPERSWNIDSLCASIKYGQERGKLHNLIVVAEGAGHAFNIAEQIKRKLNIDVRVTVLGHIQRGGTPSAFDRIIASRLGAEAVKLLLSGENDKMVGLTGHDINSVFLEDAFSKRPIIDDDLIELVKILAL